MGQRRVNIRHPAPEAVADTVRRDKTSLAGAASFMAGEGAFAFAAERAGLADVYERVWLRPSAARRLAGFLDLRPPGVIGYRVTADPSAPAQLGGRSHSLKTLTDTLHALQGATIDSEHQLRVTCCTETGGLWPLAVTLTYHHRFKLSGGQWSIDQPQVLIRAQAVGDDTLLAALVSRPEDIAQVRRAAERIERDSDGLLLEEIALPEDAVARHRALRGVLTALGDPNRMRVGSFHTRERERRAADPPADEWTASNESAAYRMRPHSVDTMFKRIEEIDDASFASVVTYLPEASGLITAITLRQNSARDDHFSVTFYGARSHEDPHARLTKDAWESARPVDWDDREKAKKVLALWATAAKVLLRPGEHAAASDADQAAA